MLKVILSVEDKGKIAEAMRKLFMFQGKKASADDLADWVDEIAEWNYPVHISLFAIKSINDAEPKMFRLGVIRNACIDKIASERVPEWDCEKLYPNGKGER